MKFTLSFDMDNDAFAFEGSTSEDAGVSEVRAILARLSDTLKGEYRVHCGDGGRVRDTNGATVGRWAVECGRCQTP